MWDIRIFQRGRNGVILTSDGRDLLDEIEYLVTSANTLDHNMRLRSKGGAGNLTFAMAPLVGGIFMPSLLTFTKQNFPNISVVAMIRTLDELINDLRRDRIEICIFTESHPPQDQKIDIQDMGAFPLAFAARADHPLTRRDRRVWAEMSRFPFATSPHSRLPNLPKAPDVVSNNHEAMKRCMMESDTIWYT